MECLTPTVSFGLFMDSYFASFRLFVCLPTLDLTTFEQEVCSTKLCYANTRGHHRRGQTAAKKETWPL